MSLFWGLLRSSAWRWCGFIFTFVFTMLYQYTYQGVRPHYQFIWIHIALFIAMGLLTWIFYPKFEKKFLVVEKIDEEVAGDEDAIVNKLLEDSNLK